MSKKDEKHTSKTSNSPTDIRVLKLDEINFVAGGWFADLAKIVIQQVNVPTQTATAFGGGVV